MALIGSTDFYIGVRSLPKRQFEEYSARLFDEWEIYVDQTLQLPDYSLSLVVEEGSIKAVGKIAAALGVLYIGIGQYGSFISGLQIIHGQVRAVTGYLGEQAAAPFQSSPAKPKVRRNGESLSRLQSLFVKVQEVSFRLMRQWKSRSGYLVPSLRRLLLLKMNSSHPLRKLRFIQNSYRFLLSMHTERKYT